ncbi:MAG: PHP domain-containing protein [Candidatus Omnitrophota bacterium]|jgi:predicted metal-dependent phosphoesterase TrpH
MKSADLHLHTVFSDGTYTPQELVRKSKKAGLDTIAVTDHDTIGGIEPAMDVGRIEGLEVLSGIELSAEYLEKEIHILGYLIDYKSPKLKAQLDKLKDNRIERIYKIIAKLKEEAGLDLNPGIVFDIAKGGVIGRLHIARAMVKEGLAGSVAQAFQKYIGDKCPAYVLGFKFTPAQAIKLIKDAAGVPILAHPYIINDDNLILEFVKDGLMGLEAYYPEHTQGMVNFYVDFCKKNNLLITGGSDCHGSAKPEVKIGSVKIPYEMVDKLKEARQRL